MSNAPSSLTSGASTLRPDRPTSVARLDASDRRDAIDASDGRDAIDASDGRDAIWVLVVDDHPGFRRALERALRRSPGLRLVGSAHTGEEAVVMSARLVPRVVVMDLAMPGMSGVEATRRLMAQPDPPAVVALSGSRELMRDAIAAGACRALLKEGDLTELLTTIRLAAAR